MATADHCGSTHDRTCWKNSALYSAIRGKKLDPRLFVIDDEAFTNLQQILSPYSGRGLGWWSDAFNYWLSHSRQSIKRAFGMLFMKWGIFSPKFLFVLERWSTVIMVSMKLHNICLDWKVKIPKHRFDEDIVIDHNDEEMDQMLRLTGTGDRRTVLTDGLENEGRGRPVHAEVNSRA